MDCGTKQIFPGRSISMKLFGFINDTKKVDIIKNMTRQLTRYFFH